jgi:hypothetical protein
MAGPIGTDRAVGMALETTWGTAVSPPTHWAPVTSLGLAQSYDRRKSPLMGRRIGGGRVLRDFATLASDVAGTIGFIPTYDDTWFGLLLDACFYGTPSTSGAGPYQHVWTLGNEVEDFEGLTLEVIRGRHASLAMHEIFEGCLVSEFTLSAVSRDWCALEVGFMGQTSGGLVAGNSPSVTLGEEMVGDHPGVFAFNGNNHTLRSISLTVNHSLTTVPALGQVVSARMAAGAEAAMVTGQLQLDWADHNLYTEFRAATQGNGTITLQGTGNNSLAIQIDNMFLRTHDFPADGHGLQTLTVDFEALADASDTGLQFTLQNDNASHK